MTSSQAHESALRHAEELLLRRQLRESLNAWSRAEGMGAEADRCAAGRWQVYMLLGDFEEAWRESDAIRLRGSADPHRFWQGEDLTGKRIILRCLHGFGDAVQFLRYAPGLRRRASQLLVEVPPELLELAPFFDGVTDVLTWGAGAPVSEPAWDVQLEINESPYLMRTQSADLPVATNYLQIPDALRAAIKLRPNDASKVRVGVVWASGAWNTQRSVPFDLLHPILRSSHCEFWNLQGGTAREQWRADGLDSRWHSAPECEHSLAKLAAVIAQLDLVLTCDTLAAHLAGALGTPAWVMLQHASDWRWQHARGDSPWYPSLRLFRQPCPGDWPAVIANVVTALADLSSQKRQGELLS